MLKDIRTLSTKKVLLSENIKSGEVSVKSLLEHMNMKVLECANGIEIVRKSFTENPDIVIIDIAMPLLNGYLCTRILKNDPVLRSIPVILIGSTEQLIDQYWAMASGADRYLQKPVLHVELEKTIRKTLRRKTVKSSFISPPSPYANLKDIEILTLANEILEHKFFQAEIMHEINEIDVLPISMKELVISVMTIIGSMYNFSLGMVLFRCEEDLDFIFFQNKAVDQQHLDEIKSVVLKHLQEKYILLPKHINQDLPQSDQVEKSRGEAQDVYIHNRNLEENHCFLAFENIGFDNLSADEQETLVLLLDTALGILEKKFFLDTSQKLSIIDTVKHENLMSFFMESLEKEIKNAKQDDFPLTLFTFDISNFEGITQDLKLHEFDELIQVILKSIMNSISKQSIVARLNVSSFAFLVPHAELEQARKISENVSKDIRRSISQYFVSSSQIEPTIAMGISQFNPERDLTPELFLKNAGPKNKIQKTKSKVS